MNKNLSLLEQEAINEDTSPERLEELANIAEVAHLVAENVNSYPETLIKLARYDNYNILKGIVSNPSTPTGILIHFGGQLPQELANNPIIDFWLLEEDNPLFYNIRLLEKLAENPNTPLDLSINSTWLAIFLGENPRK